MRNEEFGGVIIKMRKSNQKNSPQSTKMFVQANAFKYIRENPHVKIF